MLQIETVHYLDRHRVQYIDVNTRSVLLQVTKPQSTERISVAAL